MVRDGTLIRTPDGAVAAEALAVGDLVVTAMGDRRPVRALTRHATCREDHVFRRSEWPVKIAAQACGPGRPSQDLYLSPDHAICLRLIDDVLVPAGLLVNGATVGQAASEDIAFWDVALDDHEILVANDLPVESRRVAVEAEATDSSAAVGRRCIGDGAIVRAVRSQMRRRLAPLGWRTVQPPPQADMHLIVDGEQIAPVMSGMAAKFRVPAVETEIGLVSSAVAPMDIGDSKDERVLGICVGGLVLADGFETRTIALDDPRLGEGWHSFESDASAIWRWSDGTARLPRSLWEGMDAGFFLRVELACAALPHWIGPDER